MNKEKCSALVLLTLLMSSKILAMEFSATKEMSTETSSQENIVIVGTPRSATTALLHLYARQKNYTAYNEPGTPVFFPEQSFLYTDARHRSYAQIREMYESASAPVVVKEISYVANSFFMSEPRALALFSRFIFLIGDPYAQALSLYEKIGSHFDLLGSKPGDAGGDLVKIEEKFTQLMGQQELYEMLQRYSAVLGKKLVLIDAHELCLKPKEVLRAVHDHFDTDFRDEDLNWQAGEKESRFVEYKIPFVASTWHDRLHRSTGFEPMRDRPAQGEKPNFDSITNLVHREIVRRSYEKNLMFYQKTMEEFAHLLIKPLEK